MKMYPTNLTDNQWQVIEKIINAQERKRKHSLRGIMNAILSARHLPQGRGMQVPTPDECPTKFQVLPKRWIAERSFSWLEKLPQAHHRLRISGRYRRVDGATRLLGDHA